MRSDVVVRIPVMLAILIHIQVPDPVHALQPPNAVSRHQQAVPAAECFPVEMLSEADQKTSRNLLLKALDSEALFTLAGAVKPVSEGFYSTRFRVEPPESAELEDTRRAISAWRCGDALASGILVFEQSTEGSRFASGWVAHLPSLRTVLTENQQYFGQRGITAETGAETVLLNIERAGNPDERWRGFGLVFGYPRFAIDFFCRAGLHQRETGEFIDRDFRHYPTFSRTTGGFVYAVPQLTPEQPEELAMKQRCELILGEYRRLREQEDAVSRPELILRRWYDDGTGWCHPEHAAAKLKAMIP